MSKIAGRVFLGVGLAGAMLLASGVQAADDVAAKRAELRKMCDGALATLYKAKPEVKAEVAKAAGYGCFTSFGMSFFVGGAGGSGLVHSNASKKTVYMHMGQASGGFDFGIKDYREVLVFKDAKTLEKFVTSGWEFGAAGSNAAMADGKGAKTEDTQLNSAIQVYPMTKTGLSVGAAINSRKYWTNDELNAAK